LVGSNDDVCYSRKAMNEGARRAHREAALSHVDGLFRLARRLTGGDADAEDLVQDTFARAFDASASFAQGTDLRAWLFRILRNAYIDSYRRARRSPIDVGLEPDDVGAASGDPLRGDDDLERMRSLVADDIEAALGRLSPDARTIVLLDLEGLTEGELATVLGCPVGTVKSRLARARAALRSLLCDYGSGPR